MRSLPGPPEAQPRRTPTSPVIGPADHDRTGRNCATHAPAAPLRSQFHTPARCNALPRRFAAVASASAPMSVHGERGGASLVARGLFGKGGAGSLGSTREGDTGAPPPRRGTGIDCQRNRHQQSRARTRQGRSSGPSSSNHAHLCAAGMHGLRRISGDAGDRRHSSDAAIQT
jgi:hypothetical protein